MSGRQPPFRPIVVGEKDKLTPLQRVLIGLSENRDGEERARWLSLDDTEGAAIGSDNKRSQNLLNLLKTLERQGQPFPQTLSLYLALLGKGWTPERALIWLANLAQRGTVFRVADGNTPDGFQMFPPEDPPPAPSLESLRETFNDSGRGTAAELAVLLRFGYTPSNRGRMRALMNRNRPGARRGPVRRRR